MEPRALFGLSVDELAALLAAHQYKTHNWNAWACKAGCQVAWHPSETMPSVVEARHQAQVITAHAGREEAG